MASDRIVATYLIESAHPLEHAARVLAGEQSTGTFVRVAGETPELHERHGARVEHVEPLGEVPHPSLPGARAPADGQQRWRRGRAVVSFPLANMGTSLPNLASTVMGNLYELGELSAVRLLDLELPRAFADAHPGPQFGVGGTRRLAGVEDRPLVGTIVKPSVGLSPADTAALVRTLCEAGLDFIKDDELQANGPHSPLEARVAAVMRVIDEHAQRTGKKVMYAFNISDELDAMLRHHDTVAAAGGTCVMVAVQSVGLAAVGALRRRAALPIHGHRAGWGALTRAPGLGADFAAWHKLWRLAGVDHLHCNGLRNKFWEPDDSVVRSVRACLAPLYDTPAAAYTVMPVLSSGQWAGQVSDTYERMRTRDLVYLCGGGIIGHPGGVAAGVASVRQAWEAALAGRSLAEHARTHPELAQALAAFGK